MLQGACWISEPATVKHATVRQQNGLHLSPRGGEPSREDAPALYLLSGERGKGAISTRMRKSLKNRFLILSRTGVAYPGYVALPGQSPVISVERLRRLAAALQNVSRAPRPVGLDRRKTRVCAIALRNGQARLLSSIALTRAYGLLHTQCRRRELRDLCELQPV